MEVKSGEGTVVVADRNHCEVMKGQQEIEHCKRPRNC